jgi:hypothetical protein
MKNTQLWKTGVSLIFMTTSGSATSFFNSDKQKAREHLKEWWLQHVKPGSHVDPTANHTTAFFQGSGSLGR